MTMHQITLTPHGSAAGVHGVVIDGQDVSDAVQSATLQLDGGAHPVLQLNLRLTEAPVIGAGPAVVSVPYGTHAALELLGWTAPPDPGDPPGGDLEHVDWALGLAVRLLQGHHQVECDCVDDHRCKGWKCGRCEDRWPCVDSMAQSNLLEARKRLGYRAEDEEDEWVDASGLADWLRALLQADLAFTRGDDCEHDIDCPKRRGELRRDPEPVPCGCGILESIARAEVELAILARHEEEDGSDFPCSDVRLIAFGYRHRPGYEAEKWAL